MHYFYNHFVIRNSDLVLRRKPCLIIIVILIAGGI